MSADTQPGLTKVTVNLTPPAMAALNTVADTTGDGHTDTINRALTTYEVLRSAEQGTVLQLDDDDPHRRILIGNKNAFRRLKWTLVRELGYVATIAALLAVTVVLAVTR